MQDVGELGATRVLASREALANLREGLVGGVDLGAAREVIAEAKSSPVAPGPAAIAVALRRELARAPRRGDEIAPGFGSRGLDLLRQPQECVLRVQCRSFC